MGSIRRKSLSLLLAAALTAVALPLSYSRVSASSSMGEWSGTSGTFAYDESAGTLTVRNRPDQNNLVLSGTTAAAFTLEVDMTLQDGAKVGGILLQSPAGAPFAALHVNGNGLRLFSDYGEMGLVEQTAPLDPGVRDRPIHLKITRGMDKRLLVFVDNSKTPLIDYVYEGADSLRLGFTTYSTTAVFANIAFAYIRPENALDGFTGTYREDPATGAITVLNGGGNNYVVADTRAKAFSFEADLSFSTGTGTAGLLFGAATPSPDQLGLRWNALHVRNHSDARLFCESTWDQPGGLNEIKPIRADAGTTVKLRLEADDEGTFRAYVNGECVITAKQDTYEGGYVGLCSYACEVRFDNIRFVTKDPAGFQTNLTGWRESRGWSMGDRGYRGDNGEQDEAFSMSDVTLPAGAAFIYEGDLHIDNESGHGGLVFGVPETESPLTVRYEMSVDKKAGLVRLFKTGGSASWGVQRKLTAAEQARKNYRLRLIRLPNGTINFYMDGALVGICQETDFPGGRFGVMTRRGDVTFNHIAQYPVTDPLLTGLKLIGGSLIEAFDSARDDYTAEVDAATKAVRIKPAAEQGLVVTINSQKVASGEESPAIPLRTGWNLVTVVVKEPASELSCTITIRILRRSDPTSIYTSVSRPQFHFTPQVNWMNDPNGLVYDAETGEYHMFYQHNPYGMGWGNLSWGHATSKDLVRWTEQPVALFPDDYGNKWSGSGVVDRLNTSGLFGKSTPPDARLVLLPMNNEKFGHGMSLAYSRDNGRTWDKYLGGATVLSGAGDGKVIWYEDKTMQPYGGIWLMITTGVNLYTSKNLKDWTFNSTLRLKDGSPFYNWECPDLYPLPVDGDEKTVKWVYNAGGSFYLVGDIEKSADGRLTFRAETDPQLYNGDSLQYRTDYFPLQGDSLTYATQSYFNDPKGRRLSVSWIREFTGDANDPDKGWNGAQTVPHVTTLTAQGGGLRLLSYPAEEVNALRDGSLYSGRNVKVTPQTPNILAGKQGVLMDIEGVFAPGPGVSEFGFKIRRSSDGKQETVIRVDMTSGKLILDKSRSGESYTAVSSMDMTPLADGTVKLRILADTSILEVFGNGGQAPISTAFYPDPASRGLEFYTVGGDVTVQSLDIYGMRSSWIPLEETPSLEGLELSAGQLTPAFDPAVYDYTVTVDASVASIRVKPLYSGDFTVTVNGKPAKSGVFSEAIPLKPGHTNVIIQAGDTLYTLTILRQKDAPATTSSHTTSASATSSASAAATSTKPGGGSPLTGAPLALPAAFVVMAGAMAAVIRSTRKKR